MAKQEVLKEIGSTQPTVWQASPGSAGWKSAQYLSLWQAGGLAVALFLFPVTLSFRCHHLLTGPHASQ